MATTRPGRDSSSALTLLVVDDDPQVLRLLQQLGERAGFEASACRSGREALERLTRERVDVAIVDLKMPGVGGLDVLRAIQGADPDCQTILMSGAATIDSALEAAKLGAIDYLTKPFDFDRVKALLASVKDEAARRRRLLAAEREVAKDLEFCGMIGRSAVMQELFALVRRLAPHIRTALIAGETGVGKELVARALYQSGPRRARRFVPLNCSAIAETLVESELFGHTRGAFTGATESRPGVFEAADGGTLFLDEIGDLPLATQAKLLRTLESGEVQRVGSVDPRHVDVHVLAATNRDLRADVDAGRFRADLYYRLNVVEIFIAPLRERREDIPYLVAAFVREANGRLGKHLVGPTPAAERWLAEARWEGNVRELRNVIERACILADGEFITERELSGLSAWPAGRTEAAGRGLAGRTAAGPVAHDLTLSTLERARIQDVLRQTGGNKLGAARVLGLSRRALYRRLERYGLGT